MAGFQDKLYELQGKSVRTPKKRTPEKKTREEKFYGFDPERVKTGILGLDEVLHGGIPWGNLVVIAGGPGSGKTSLGLQFIYEGAKQFNEPGVFISLEEDPERLVSNAEKLGWDFKPLIEQGKVLIVKSSMFNLNNLFRNIKESVKQVRAKRIVIDPGALLRLFFETEVEVRKAFVELANVLKNMGITSLVTTDFNAEAGKQFEMEEYAADGVLLLYYFRNGNIYQRMVAILKMRGTGHSEKVHPFKISIGGITIYPEEEVFSEVD